MLSKSQAKWFFLVATGGFSGVFLWLTFDTMRQVPERSHEENMSEQVVRGKEIWEKNNCMGCHTLLGEGAYYAPELTKVYERRGPVWMATFLADPQAMYPGQRKMVQYDFTEDEISDLIEFFKWIGEIETNGFPAEPDLVVPTSAEVAVTESVAAPDVYNGLCVACHARNGSGGQVGPALDGVESRYTEAELRAWLQDPTSVKPETAMPNLNLSPSDVDALVAYLLPDGGAQ